MVLQHLASGVSIVVILCVFEHAASFRYNCSSSWTSNGGWIEIQYNGEEVMNTDWIFRENPSIDYWGWDEEASAYPGVDISRFRNEEFHSDDATSKLTWHQTIQHIEAIGFVAYSSDRNFVDVAFLSRMEPDQSGQDPVEGNWISNYIVVDYFPPEMLFSPGDDIVFSFEITDLGDVDYELHCRSLQYGHNDILTRGIEYHAAYNGYERWSDAVGGVNITVTENEIAGGKARLIQILIPNASEKHIGQYECGYLIRLTPWDEHPNVLMATTGARLLASQDAVLPVKVVYEVGYDLLGSAPIDYRAMIPAGSPNVIKCTITYGHLPGNVSLYFQDESLQLSGPLISNYYAYNAVAYQYRIGRVTAANAGIYKWIIEIGNRVIEKEIEVEVASG